MVCPRKQPAVKLAVGLVGQGNQLFLNFCIFFHFLLDRQLHQIVYADCSVGTDAHAVSISLSKSRLDVCCILVHQIIWKHSHNYAGKAASVYAAGPRFFSAINISVRASATQIPCSCTSAVV